MGLGIKMVCGVAAAAVGANLAISALSNDHPEDNGPAMTSVIVERVVDGDTVLLTTGERVRLIGIDAPEVGSCGFRAATDLLAGLVEGEAVVLTNPASVQDTDKYSRLLRYINLASTDVGLELIATGHPA